MVQSKYTTAVIMIVSESIMKTSLRGTIRFTQVFLLRRPNIAPDGSSPSGMFQNLAMHYYKPMMLSFISDWAEITRHRTTSNWDVHTHTSWYFHGSEEHTHKYIDSKYYDKDEVADLSLQIWGAWHRTFHTDSEQLNVIYNIVTASRVRVTRYMPLRRMSIRAIKQDDSNFFSIITREKRTERV